MAVDCGTSRYKSSTGQRVSPRTVERFPSSGRESVCVSGRRATHKSTGVQQCAHQLTTAFLPALSAEDRPSRAWPRGSGHSHLCYLR